MENVKPGWIYISVDGDGIGKLVGRAVLANDVDELHSVSSRIDAAQDFILHWCKQVGGTKISGGGDEATMAAPRAAKHEIKNLRASVEKAFGYTLSVGVGMSLSEAGTALLVAKLRGKNRIVWFDKKIKDDIKKAKRRVREKRASPDEYKLSEAYLEKSENMLCDLHKDDTKALATQTKEGEVVPKSNGFKYNPGQPGVSEESQRKHHAEHLEMKAKTRVLSGKTKPTMSHEEMLKLPDYVHGTMATKHREKASSLDPKNTIGGTGGNQEASNKHHKASSMHSAYERHLKSPNDRTNHLFVNDEQHAKAQKEAGEEAHKLHNDLSSLETSGHKVGPALEHKKSEQYMCDLHKHEEGFHAPQTEPDVEDPCPYCQDNEDNRTDDCQYCQSLDAQENADGTAGMDGCPACEDYDASKQNTGGIDDCPYCQTENITEVQANPDQSDLAVEDMGAQHPDDCPECQELYSDAVENQPDQTGQSDPNLQGHETAEEVLNSLDQEPGADGQTPAQKAKKIDNTELPQGDAMEDGTSVTENFGPTQTEDVSDSERDMNQSDQQGDDGQGDTEDGPNMSEVLQGGLDDHANEQKRKEVINMVAQTLQGFKANKAALEATKDQNTGLYQSCIQMLKSMIELCKLLGLEPTMPAQVPNDPGAVAEATQSGAPSGPKQAAPSEGAAQDPKTQG